MEAPATDPEYQLSKGDEITISVFNRGEFSISQRIDNRGLLRLKQNEGCHGNGGGD